MPSPHATLPRAEDVPIRPVVPVGEGETTPASATRPPPADAGTTRPPVPLDTPSAAPRPRPDSADTRLFPGITDAEIDAMFRQAESGPLVRVGADQPGADTRPLRTPPAEDATLLQRQRAGALHEQAGTVMQEANQLLNRAIDREAEARLADSHNPRRARALREDTDRLLNRAVDLERQANAMRRDADDFASGRRSATEDLPGPADVEAAFAGLTSEAPGLVRIPLSDVERNPALLPRMIRSLLEGENGGRMVFRVESERSRSLVHVDANGNVTVEGGASAHLNFGSFERAVEFVMQNSRGNARIIAFEVDEAWVRSARSAAIPEYETAALGGRQPRLVDVRFADDQLEITPQLIGELNRFILPGSGRVHEIPGRTPPAGDAGLPPDTGVPPRPPSTPNESAVAAILRGDPTPPPRSQTTIDSTPARPETGEFREGTAAGVRGSDFQGDAIKPETLGAARLQHAHNAVESLVSTGGLHQGSARLPDSNDPSHVRVSTRSGEEVSVRIKMADQVLPPEADGLSPVAKITYNKETGEYLVEISPGARREHVERALAHELAEIRAAHKREVPDDVLSPGGKPPRVRPGETPRLSPHDEGRLAELAVIARQLQETTDPARRTRLQDDAERLVAALGLVGPGEAATARRAVAVAAIETPGDGPGALRLPPEAAALLRTAAVSAETNPFLIRTTGALASDLGTIRRSLERIDSIEDPKTRETWREQLQKVAAQVLIDSNVVRRGRGGPISDMAEFARHLGLDLATLPPLLSASPDPLVRLMDQARLAAVKGIEDGTMSRSSARKPTPGFEAEFVDDKGNLLPKKRALRDEESLTPNSPEAIDDLDARCALQNRAKNLEQELKAKGTTEGRRQQIRQELDQIDLEIIKLSERLGEAAGREFARQQLGNPKEEKLPRAGAGVPDLVFEGPNGKLIIIECKGGTAGLGTRQSADQRFTVEQGTVEYLQSLARTMENSSDPKIRELGERLRTELAKNPPNVDYFLVKQPFTPDGDLAAPQVGKFDLRPNAPRPTS
jgi:hypothetical protein